MSQLVEIICIGNELLIGKTLNTNAQWLAKRITSLGVNVRRITTVGDDVGEISDGVREAVRRGPRFLITTGGLGPTFDDKTMEGIANALGCSLEINDEALTMVEAKYRKYVEEGKMAKVDMTPPRVKMSKLPEGAKPLFNPVGTAVGMLVERKGTTMLALPGVPSEMKAIFEESILPLLTTVAGELIFFETSIESTGVMESEIAPVIDQVMHENPYVYIKSHPKGAERIPHIEFHFSTTAKNSSVARKRLSKALVHLSVTIQRKGGKIKSLETKI